MTLRSATRQIFRKLPIGQHLATASRNNLERRVIAAGPAVIPGEPDLAVMPPEWRSPSLSEPRMLYLDLLKKSLTFMTYAPNFLDLASANGIRLVAPSGTELNARVEGRDFPFLADTMVGLKRLENLQLCVESILAENIPGDLIECGVWRGGASIFLRGLLKAHGVVNRSIGVADSFRGMPSPNPRMYPADERLNWQPLTYLAVSLEQVQANFKRYGLLDEQVRFLKGWFCDSLPTMSGRQWSLIRLDGDLYQSTMEGLTHLYPNLSPHGYIIIDDYYGISACRQAVDDYRKAQGISDELVRIDWTGVYWRRDRPAEI